METVNPSVAEWTAKSPKGNGVGRSLFALDLMKSFAATRQWLRNIWEKFRSFCLMIWSRKEPILWFNCSLVWCKMPPAEAKEHRGGVVLNEKSTARFHKMEMGCGFFWGSLKNNDYFCKKFDKLRKTEYKIHRPFPGMGKTCGFFSRFWGNGMAAHIAFFCPISAFGYLPCSFYRKSASRTGCTQSLKVWPLALCHYLNELSFGPLFYYLSNSPIYL